MQQRAYKRHERTQDDMAGITTDPQRSRSMTFIICCRVPGLGSWPSMDATWRKNPAVQHETRRKKRPARLFTFRPVLSQR